MGYDIIPVNVPCGKIEKANTSIGISMAPTGNMLEFGQAIRVSMTQLAAELPHGIELHVVADHALAHRAANIKRHGGGNADRVLVLQNNAADLRAVAVRKNDLIAFFNDVRNIGGCFFNDLQLRFRCCRAVSLLQRVAAQSDDQLFHGIPPKSQKNRETLKLL